MPLMGIGEPETSSEESSGGKTSYKAKTEFSQDSVDQLLGHAVVTSFVHGNRHPNQNPLVPAVGISCLEGEVMALLYDCRKDALLLLLSLPPSGLVSQAQAAVFSHVRTKKAEENGKMRRENTGCYKCISFRNGYFCTLAGRLCPNSKIVL